MAAQLQLDLSRPAQPTATTPTTWKARLLALARGALLWTPVWVPLVFLGQLVGLGLLPAQVEAARLDRAQGEVEQRVEALQRERDQLAEDARMLSDEVYQERVRRSLVDPAAAPLTLERARAASRQ
jgi:hypothetical protein